MSETRETGPGGSGEKIIDAEVEPVGAAARRRRLRVALLLAAAIVASIVIAAGWHLWQSGRLDLAMLTGGGTKPPAQAAAPAAAPPPAASPAAAPPAAAAETQKLAQRIDALERRLVALGDGIERLQQVTPADGATATVSPQQLTDLSTGLQAQMQQLMQARQQNVDAKLAALETAVAALQEARDSQAAGRIVMQQRMDEIDARLSAVNDNRTAALRAPVQQLLAWSELRDRARRGEGFAAELPVLAALAEKAAGQPGEALRAGLADLQPFAESGVPAPAALLAAFPAAAAAQGAAFRAPDPAADAARPWWQRAIDKMTGLVSIRRADAPDMATPDGKLAAAEAALQAGDLAAAIAALDGMTPVPALAGWRRQAEARLALDAVLGRMAGALQAHFASP
ncbi:hypothetical protein [Ferrovibrio sp.]|uniref:hypothetical protein n=1 Tax=Ferrovibrio sp. TaxID=1917215 RepID=UPI003518541C